ncbi:MAG TPA: sigma-70 family RNA polymerase sigma factor [Kribbella sp.]|nr:sigma-70 family RNA polymerase sigma factor [Kribbella sp.]
MRVTRDLDVAEEAVQEAYVKALSAWPDDGIPIRPGAWLTTVARRTALNILRRRRSLEAKLPLLLESEQDGDTDDENGAVPDDRLRLIFTCCHPALSPEAQVALTLRLVCGLRTPDIAHAFLVSETTMAARLTRAKKKITVARIRYAVPDEEDLPERGDAVLNVIHLLYTAGHTAPSGAELTRDDLSERAIDLARMLRLLLPRFAETGGLLALLLVLHARRAARVGADGRLLRLSEQDRSLWDKELIAEADELLVESIRMAPAGRFTLQAAIAAVHAQAPSFADTDWPQILALYDRLQQVWVSPVVTLNRAVAVAMIHGAGAGLAEVEQLEATGRLGRFRYLYSTKADLLHQLGRDAEAVEAYRTALSLTDNDAEQEFLVGQISAVGGGGRSH